MGSAPCPPGERINLFSLVTYLPDPLASFIDHLRAELVPGCSLRAHITVLPPRPLKGDPAAVSREIGARAAGFEPFQLEMDEVEIFTDTSVVYVALTRGFSKMVQLHDTLNQGLAFSDEAFPYHPHITLAQQITPEQLPAVFEHARYRWAEFAHERSFVIDRVTFVQATDRNSWIDLAEYRLGGHRPAGG